MAASRNNPRTDLPARIGQVLAAHLAPADTVCVGLSGGCDSVVVLHALSQLDLAGRLSALHVHHGLSPRADAWADFCAEFCGQRAIPLEIARVVVPHDSGEGLEAAARAARYAQFRNVAASVIVLAQQRSDQAETLLFNLLRGAGVRGAAAMPVVRPLADKRLLRPLLEISRQEIEAYARAVGLAWVEDESNADTRFSRNFLRHEVMPVLAGRFPAAEAGLARSAAHFAEAEDLLAELAAADWARADAQGEGSAAIGVLRQLSMPRLKNLLRWRLHQLGWRAPASERLEEFARQLHTAAPDRHPELLLTEGRMRVAQCRLHWLPVQKQSVTCRLSPW